jgi:hypothetical protein
MFSVYKLRFPFGASPVEQAHLLRSFFKWTSLLLIDA